MKTIKTIKYLAMSSAASLAFITFSTPAAAQDIQVSQQRDFGSFGGVWVREDPEVYKSGEISKVRVCMGGFLNTRVTSLQVEYGAGKEGALFAGGDGKCDELTLTDGQTVVGVTVWQSSFLTGLTFHLGDGSSKHFGTKGGNPNLVEGDEKSRLLFLDGNINTSGANPEVAGIGVAFGSGFSSDLCQGEANCQTGVLTVLPTSPTPTPTATADVPAPVIGPNSESTTFTSSSGTEIALVRGEFDPATFGQDVPFTVGAEQCGAHNIMIDGWRGPEASLLRNAADEFFKTKGWAPGEERYGNLENSLKTDPVMRWQFAPFMLGELYRAVLSGGVNYRVVHGRDEDALEQQQFRTRFNNWVSCNNRSIAFRSLDLLKAHLGETTSLGESLQVVEYKPTTLSSVLLDTGPTIRGFDMSNGGNAMYLGPKGLEAVATLYKPLFLATMPDLIDLYGVGLTKDNMIGLRVGLNFGSTAAMAGVMSAAMGGAVARQNAQFAARHAAAKAKLALKSSDDVYKLVLQANLDSGLSQADAAAKAAAKAKDASGSAGKLGKELVEELGEEAVEKAAKQASEKAAIQGAKKFSIIAGKTFSSKVLSAIPIVSGLTFFAEVFAEVVGGHIETKIYRDRLQSSIDSDETFDSVAILGDNPGAAETGIIFSLITKMTIADPADQGLLTLAIPLVPCSLGQRLVGGDCELQELDFLARNDLSAGFAPMQNGAEPANFVYAGGSRLDVQPLSDPANAPAFKFEKVGDNYRIFRSEGGSAYGDPLQLVGTDDVGYGKADNNDGSDLWRLEHIAEDFYRIGSVKSPHRYLRGQRGDAGVYYIEPDDMAAVWHIPMKR
jgi:hypothetical protein